MAAALIAEWVARGNARYTLYIEGVDDVTLPPLPVNLKRLYCVACPNLRRVRQLPAGLVELGCQYCPVLRCLGELPAGLRALVCTFCPLLLRLPDLSALHELGYVECYNCVALRSLPPGLRVLSWAGCSPLPDTCPIMDESPLAEDWPANVRWHHTKDRFRAMAVSRLPRAAAAYV